jgi:ABC-type phosphate transport system substrate-binding protein
MVFRLTLLLAAVLGLGFGHPARAELVVVVPARSEVEALSRDQVINIFLGRYRQLPSGITATPIDQPREHADKARFYRLLVNKDLTEIDAYWARLVFSGKTPPPRQANSSKAVTQWLSQDKGAIGYMERAQADARVKVVFSFGP